jgi:hypothetical protein
MIMAKKIPTNTIHHGTNGGRVRANNQAVVIALKSVRKGRIGRLRIFKAMVSKLTANSIDKIILNKIPQPKKKIITNEPGMSANSTCSIIPLMFWLLLKKGEVLVLNCIVI